MHARPVECETLKCENPRHLGVDPVRRPLPSSPIPPSPAFPIHSGTSLAIPRSPGASDAAVARQDPAHSTRATRQSCPFMGTCVCSPVGTLREARRASAGRAASRLAGLCGRGEAWCSSWPSWSAPCMPRTQPIRTAPLPPLLGRAGDRSRTSDACMRGRYSVKCKIATPPAT